MEKFLNLKVWHKAHQLVLEIYKITKNFPNDEKFGLVSQMRRAAIAVTANIVEGTKRKTAPDRKHFHVISDTSLEELKYYIILSSDLNFINNEDSEKLINICREIGKMLGGLNKTIF